MTRILFQHPDGSVTEVEGRAGQSLLEAGQAAGMPLEGTCEGQMACSTCHVIVPAEWFARLPRASEPEEDMLDLAAGACRTSRLACQLSVDALADGFTVRLPGEVHNMQGI